MAFDACVDGTPIATSVAIERCHFFVRYELQTATTFTLITRARRHRNIFCPPLSALLMSYSDKHRGCQVQPSHWRAPRVLLLLLPLSPLLNTRVLGTCQSTLSSFHVPLQRKRLMLK